jgi:hypothetical protein
MRIETLEAPTAALNGLILVVDSETSWLYDVRHSRLEAESAEPARIPLSSDALDAIDWLFLKMEDATVLVSGRDTLESGATIRLDIALPSGDRAVLWVHDETGFPSRVELHSTTWGEAHFTARRFYYYPVSQQEDIYEDLGNRWRRLHWQPRCRATN